MKFTEEKCRGFNNKPLCEPPGALAPFLSVDRSRYEKLRADTEKSQLNLEELQKRVGKKNYADIRGALSITTRYSQSYFPAYRFHAGEFVNDEWLATVDWHKKFHRDHVVHQSMSATIGLWMLNGGRAQEDEKNPELIFPPNTLGYDAEAPEEGLTLLDLCIKAIFLPGGEAGYLLEHMKELGAPKELYENKPIARALWRAIVLDTFFLAALFHDMGYPWNFVSKIHECLGPHEPIENPAEQGSRWIAQRYGKRLVFFPLNGYKKIPPDTPTSWPEDFEKIVRLGLTSTHGMPGAISFLYLNDVLKKHPDGVAAPARRFCIEWAAMAIMMHDMTKVYGKVKDGVMKVKNPQMRLRFNRDPLSCLLTLVDLIQDFARPNATFRDYDDAAKPNKDSVIATYGHCCTATDVKWKPENGELKLTYYYKNKTDLAIQLGKFVPENQIQYFDPDKGYLDFSGIGIRKVTLDAKLEK